MDVGIIRQPKPEELADFQPIGYEEYKTPQDKLKDEINKQANLVAKKQDKEGMRLPFATQIAEIEYKDEINKQATKIMRETGRKYLNDSDLAKIKVPKVDWSKYSDLKNFELMEEGEHYDREMSKHHRMAINVKFKRYKFNGYAYEYIVMEDADHALERARKKLVTEQGVK